MKYTRYNIKRNKGENAKFILIFILILVIATILGTIISNLFIKKDDSIKNSTSIDVKKVPNKKNQEIQRKTAKAENEKIDKYLKFFVIQCGVFKNNENAKVMQNNLNQVGNPFIIKDNDLYKVILGIYFEDKIDNMMNNLKKKKIEATKVTYNIKVYDVCTAEISELISANLNILNKLSSENIKSIKTESLKKWSENLEEVKEDNKNYNTLVQLKDHVNKLPNEIKNTEVKSGYAFIYNIMKNLSNE